MRRRCKIRAEMQFQGANRQPVNKTKLNDMTMVHSDIDSPLVHISEINDVTTH